MDDNPFEETFEKASRIADKFLEKENKKLGGFIDEFGKEIEDYMHEVGGHMLRK